MTDLEALVVAAYVFADEYRVPARCGRPPLVSDAELVALAVCQASIGASSDRQFLGLVERVLPSNWGGKKLASLNEPGRFLLTAVTRLGEAQIAGPKLVGQEGDILHFVVDINDLDALQARLSGRPEEGGH